MKYTYSPSKGLVFSFSLIVIILLFGATTSFGLSNSKYINQSNQPTANNYSNITQNKTSNNSPSILNSSQLSVCKTKQSQINSITNSITAVEQNQLSGLTTVTLRLESLYSQKSKIISNYSQTINQIGLIQTKAYSDFTSLKSTSLFSCTSSDPIVDLINYQSYLKNEINDLISLRNSVNNLIISIAKVNNIVLKNNP